MESVRSLPMPHAPTTSDYTSGRGLGILEREWGTAISDSPAQWPVYPVPTNPEDWFVSLTIPGPVSR